jgi:hypothetical protein
MIGTGRRGYWPESCWAARCCWFGFLPCDSIRRAVNTAEFWVIFAASLRYKRSVIGVVTLLHKPLQINHSGNILAF